jgi:hypothetical protein
MDGLDMSFLTTSCPMPAPAGGIIGPGIVCANSSGHVYSVTSIANATGYNWTVPPGSIITAGANTNSITVTHGITSGNVSVTGTNSCGNGGISTQSITVNPAPVPTISGQNSMCVNSGYYYYTTQAGFSNYTWTVSSGGTINFGGGTNTVQVSWNTEGTQSVSVNYANSFGCMAATPATLPITVNGLPIAAGTITGTPILCSGTMGVPYSVGTIANALAYVWTIPQGAAIASGSGTNTITIDWNTVSGPQTISVYGNNLCGNGTISPAYAVTVNPIPAAPVVTNSGYTAESDALAGNQWYFNGTLIAGANDQTYDATLSGTGFYWSVVTLNNCSSDTSNHKYIVVTGVNEPKTGMISVYPNPNDGQFRVKLSSIKQASFNISVINNMGLKINEIRDIVVIGNIEKNIDLRPVPAGIYSVVIKNSESTVVKKIVINK